MKSEIPPGVVKGGIALLVLIVLLIVGTRTWAYEGKAVASAQKKDQQVTQIDAQIKQAQQVIANPKAWHAQQVALEKAIPVSFGLDNVILVITQLAHTAGVVWTEGSPPSSQAITGAKAPAASTQAPSGASAPPSSSAPSIGGVNAQPMTIQVTGSLGQLESFIQGISGLPRLITLTGMQVTAGGSSGGASTGSSSVISSNPTSLASQVSASLSLVVYSLNS